MPSFCFNNFDKLRPVLVEEIFQRARCHIPDHALGFRSARKQIIVDITADNGLYGLPCEGWIVVDQFIQGPSTNEDILGRTIRAVACIGNPVRRDLLGGRLVCGMFHRSQILPDFQAIFQQAAWDCPGSGVRNLV